MLIRVTSETDQPQTLQVKIIQNDLDRDRVVFTQPIDIGGSDERRGHSIERYWAYFRPQPTDRGLPDLDRSALAKALVVNLVDPKDKLINALKITSTVQAIDTPLSGTSRAARLVLCVSDSGDAPVYEEYDKALGRLTDVEMVTVSPEELPDDVIGYEAVDAIVWMDADANKLTQGTRGSVLRAVQQYVRQGGHLLVCQPAEPAHVAPFADLLPILSADASGRFSVPMEDRGDLDVLARITHVSGALSNTVIAGGSYKVARAVPRPDALIEEWTDWPNDGKGPQHTPYLARVGYGSGVVSWVAQDLGSIAVRRGVLAGWVAIWNRMLDWKDQYVVPTNDTSVETLQQRWDAGRAADASGATLTGMDLTSKTAGYLLVAVIFFLVYWVVAGPGAFLYLVGKRRAHLSWFAFGILALAATGLTVVVVWLVRRLPTEIGHLTLERRGPDVPEEIFSRFGLYIPRDGEQRIELADVLDRSASYVVPLGLNPDVLESTDLGFTVSEQYNVPVRKADSIDPVAIAVPFRSTLKKLEANWVGSPRDAGITGRPRLVPADNGPGGQHYIAGTLTNNTGYDLTNVFLAFRHPGSSSPDDASRTEDDWGIDVGTWTKGATLDLSILMDRTATSGGRVLNADNQPGHGKPIYALIGRQAGWSERWESKLTDMHDDLTADLPTTFHILSLYQRLTPLPNPSNGNGFQSDRVEVIRRSGRRFDVSPAMAAGRLVVLAMAADVPTPLPLLVDGQPPDGTGQVLMQYVLALDRSAVDHLAAAAAPSTQQEIFQYNRDLNNALRQPGGN
jgi:hypothetical protein